MYNLNERRNRIPEKYLNDPRISHLPLLRRVIAAGYLYKMLRGHQPTIVIGSQEMCDLVNCGVMRPPRLDPDAARQQFTKARRGGTR